MTQTIKMDNNLPAINPPAVLPGGVYVYLLQSVDGSLYVGSAKDVRRRTNLHRTGRGAKFTHDHPAATLVYVEGPFDLKTAVQRERQLKRWSREKKLALVCRDIARLRKLSRSRDRLPPQLG